ncbi:LOW QUALITY PROTEIN: hypothetical protein U9M48_005449 [Paspalum notatum var. saurae]|uniref:Uncharacterized protein n=1 Tax=Paspalum notatum var. saurae TaxID=547442 RepID=A0AAQ3PQX1_PASNO
MVESANEMLDSWENRVDSEGGSAEIVVDDFLREKLMSYQKLPLVAVSSKGKEIFSKIRQLQMAMAKQNMLVGVPVRTLKTVAMVVQESLRLYPPAPFVTLGGGGLTVPKGTNIRVPVALAHRNPAAWGPDAGRFDPGRFAGGVAGVCRPTCTCAGQNLAAVELKVVLALVLQRFEFALSPRYMHVPAFRLTVERTNSML